MAPACTHFVPFFSLSYSFSPVIIMKIYLMQVCNVYIMTYINLCQVQADDILTFVTQSLEDIDKFHYIFFKVERKLKI